MSCFSELDRLGKRRQENEHQGGVHLRHRGDTGATRGRNNEGRAASGRHMGGQAWTSGQTPGPFSFGQTEIPSFRSRKARSRNPREREAPFCVCGHRSPVQQPIQSQPTEVQFGYIWHRAK